MREENLFQLATEELNSRDRKSELWARACALATDDVDEARYLYTNLRVEELAKEHNIDLSASAPMPSERGEFTLLEEDDKVDETVSLSVQYVDNMVASDESRQPEDADATALTPNAEGLTPAQVALQRARSKFTSDDEAVGATETTPATDTDNPQTATPGTDPQTENQTESKEPHSDLSLADLTADGSELADNTILIDAERGEAADATAMNLLDAGDTTASEPGAIADTAKSADPTETSALPILTDTPEDSFLADNTDNSKSSVADDFLATNSSDSQVANETSDELTLPALESGSGLESETETGVDKAAFAALAAGAAATVAAGAASGKSAATANSDDTTQNESTTQYESTAQNESATLAETVEQEQELPELETEDTEIAAASIEHDSVDRFDIYRNSEGLVNAVELGNSWKALFLTIPWMFSRRLWGHSILYVLMSLVLIAGLLTMVPRALGTAATPIDMLVAAGFVVLGLVGWLYLPFRQANNWHAARVTSKGYKFQSSADASTRKEAEQRFLVRYRLENPVVRQTDVWKNAA